MYSHVKKIIKIKGTNKGQLKNLDLLMHFISKHTNLVF